MPGKKTSSIWIGLFCLFLLNPQPMASTVPSLTHMFGIHLAHAFPEERSPATASTGCDKALTFFWKGKPSADTRTACRYFEKAIELCPGFIRPYELVGNLYRKEGKEKKAIDYFTKAAQLGSTNYKLYYLLASLLFEKGDLNEASRYLNKSLHIRPDYPKALRLKGHIENAKDNEGPKIILYEPSTHRGIRVVHNYESITVRGVVTDKSGVEWLRVNQLDVFVDQDGNFLRDTPIQVGINTIVVEAADGRGNRSRVSVQVKGEKPKTQVIEKKDVPLKAGEFYRKSFAVVIGINNYEKWPQLEFALEDAEAIRKRFEESGFDEIITILDKAATQRNILTVLGYELPKKVDRNDRVVMYFAGHGQTEDLPTGDQKGYIIPVDADTSNYFATAISMEQVRDLSRRIPAKHLLYVMDSCYSGLGLSRAAGVSPKSSGYIRKISSMRVVQIITAGGKGEQAQEKQGHGLFTRYFLRGLDGEADINHDGVVTGTELGAYLRPSVSNASSQAQTPLYGRLEGEGEFLFFTRKKH
jgi:tetratricopeptide (TPR) repeat protein